MNPKSKSGIGVYLALGIELTISIVVASFMGAWLDSKFNFNGVCVLVLILTSLIIWFVRLFRLAKNDLDEQ